MEFVVFMLAYVVRRKLDQADRLSGDVLWRKSLAHGRSVAPGRENNLVPGLLMIAIPALLIGFAQLFFQQSGWPLVHLLGLGLLLGLMGSPGLGDVLDAYAGAWRRGDMQSAWRQVRHLLPADERGEASSPELMHRAVSKTLIGQIFERYFVVAFWYVVAGIWAAFIARALVALRDHWPQAAARPGFARLASVVNFLPARLLALTFGIAGDLPGWLKGGKSAAVSMSLENNRILMASANSALTGYELEPERFSDLHRDDWPDFGERSLAAIRGLLNRCMLVWICLLALLVISGIV